MPVGGNHAGEGGPIYGVVQKRVQERRDLTDKLPRKKVTTTNDQKPKITEVERGEKDASGGLSEVRKGGV